MASRMSDERTSFVAFARQHVFVTVFGLIVPVVLFLCFIGYPILYTIYLSFFEWNGMTPVKKSSVSPITPTCSGTSIFIFRLKTT